LIDRNRDRANDLDVLTVHLLLLVFPGPVDQAACKDGEWKRAQDRDERQNGPERNAAADWRHVSRF
jgi:hypothetical protein